MIPHRLVPLALLVGLSASAAAAGFSAQEERLLEIQAARAPLALSGDGAWRLHVDAHDVLHRTRLSDPAQDSTLQLPPGVQLLSASGDGRRLALATRRQCVGLVDFGAQPGAAATLAWRPWIVNAEGVPLGPDDGAWVARMPADCGGGPQAAPVAISSDGRWIATPDAVIDTATQRVVASLPTAHDHVLRLQFVDHDARLLIAGAAPNEGRLSFSVWDLASNALVNDIELANAPLASRAALQVDFSPQTGALFAVDERRRALAQQAAGAGATSVPPPLDLVQFAPGVCGAAPRMRAQVGDDLGAAFVVDPYGRWIASARPLDAAHDAAELAMGARSVLVVQDLASGRQLARVTSQHALAGLAATPAGDRLFALATQPVEPETGDVIAGWPSVPDDERVVEVALPAVALNATRDVARAWDAGVCREPGETPGARAMARADRLLEPLWSRDLGTAVSHAATSSLPCADAAPDAAVFRTPDGGLWLDLGAQVARLAPATGALAAGLPTPRSNKVCSVVAPAGTGFLNAGGDTLTWRPLAAATDPARRRVVERRPGWTATLLPVRGDVARVAWSAPARGIVVADYDAGGKRLRESATSEAEFGGDGSDLAVATPAPCHDTRGTPLTIGYDWRAGPFGSQRGSTCGPLPGMARLVWWSGASIAPRADRSAPLQRAQPAIDGGIAVSADDTQLHVVNLALQREIAQVDLGDGFDGRTWVLASRKLVLLEATGGDGHRWLRAYALP
ncbi:MAG TPA: hypothetical protein VES00_06505 [Burkholderiaceae bacterium]|nr:hypothetical protein [Burkholderiaceae bacterium]